MLGISFLGDRRVDWILSRSDPDSRMETDIQLNDFSLPSKSSSKSRSVERQNVIYLYRT